MILRHSIVTDRNNGPGGGRQVPLAAPTADRRGAPARRAPGEPPPRMRREAHFNPVSPIPLHHRFLPYANRWIGIPAKCPGMSE
ncbi:hypothetical protein Rmet_4118 (plasmid) [Cupriavidus metallidurans CH34]|uniref:Uncharacterized protein n=1 Tax=Cupriavidus metallidurans (strain ATCC 43123 / DSM 2839 / NBRC 102507 / CH34) TaxID=266264 RepID=Q1LFU1_CUPMC|nr:hypothetical protein Rmet_4118 [Cupriavidus metallidurans CH34]